MHVFNLTNHPVDYRGKVIAPYGSAEYDISFIPDRDKKLQSAGVLSFGSLPKGWSKPAPKPSVEEAPKAVVPQQTVPREMPVAVEAAEPLEAREYVSTTTSFKNKKK